MCVCVRGEGHDFKLLGLETHQGLDGTKSYPQLGKLDTSKESGGGR